MGLLDIFNDPYQPSASSGTAGLLSPEDKLMALFSGLSGAGMAMSQPGLSKGQALAMGLGAMGPGMMQGMQGALMQRMMGQKFEDQQQQKLARDRLGVLLAGGGNGPRTDNPASGINPEHRQVMAALAGIDPGAAATMYGKAMEGNKPKDHLQEINGILYNVSDPMKPVPVANAQRPQQALGQLLEERAKAPPHLQPLYDAQIKKLNTDGGFQFTANGMAPTPGGPADLAYIQKKSGAEAWGRAPATVAINNAQNYTLGEGQVRMSGSPLDLMPGHGMSSVGPRAGTSPPAASAPPPASRPPALPGAPPGAIASMPKPASDGERKWREELKAPINQASDLVTQRDIIKTSLSKGDGTGDIAAIVAFNKLLDPGAVVREADVQLTLAAQGLADRIAVWAQNKREGDILPPALRQKMGELSDQIYEVSAKTLKSRVMPFQSVIENQGGAFGNVVPEDLQRSLGWIAPPQPAPDAWSPIPIPESLRPPSQSGGGFGTMSKGDLAKVDPTKLSPAEADAWRAAARRALGLQ